METAKSFHTEGNFLAEEIQTRVTHTVNRFNDECLAQFLLVTCSSPYQKEWLFTLDEID